MTDSTPQSTPEPLDDMVDIAGHEFPLHTDGMTLVDSYYVADEDVEQYRADRQRLADAAMRLYAEEFATAQLDFTGSEDGEAICALDENGVLVRLIHLDPDSVNGFLQAEQSNTVREYLLAQ